MDTQLKRGYLDICVLAAMYREETYGYKLIRDLSPIASISESTLYPILRRLESAGCVQSHSAEHNGRLRKYYAITPLGKERINIFKSDWVSVMNLYRFIEEATADDKE